jgi:RecA/RadA recombinase
MARPKNEKVEEKDDKIINENEPQNILGEYLKKNKEDHYNFEDTPNDIISSGSLLLDSAMNGGVRKGSILRSTGVSEGGKTSNAFSFMFNFLKEKNTRGCLIKSEGRASVEIIERSGVRFVEKAEDWVDGTCFIYKTNIYESAISLMRTLVKNNPEKISYMFIIDSLDSLVPRNDIERPFEEAGKVAGAALLTSDFLRKMALAFTSMGHICILISQVRSSIKINPYDKTPPQMTNASGGFAALHFSDWILEFQSRFNKDVIWEGEEGKSDRLGHFCKITFKKSVNEKTGSTVSYPIRYGRKGGTSVWVEYEILDMLKMWDFIKSGGKAWNTFQSSFIEEIKKECNVDLPEKFQGDAPVLKILEQSPELTKYLVNKFKSLATVS